MTSKTESEVLFESFCGVHAISCTPVPTGPARSPDYLVSLGGKAVYFEVKQIDAEESFNTLQERNSRTVGSHIRQKIADSRGQIQPPARASVPCALLVYNNLDPFQAFGTEPHDFTSAMYGEMTVVFKDSVITDSYHGRNAFLRQGHNTSFSAVGHLRKSPTGPAVCLYENVFARNPLDFSSVPACIEVVRIEVAANVA